jgi:subtilisin-like proprotein convertase family protein
MRAKLHFVLSITILFGGFYSIAQQDYWRKITSRATSDQVNVGNKESTYELDRAKFVQVLGKVGKGQTQIMQFPDDRGAVHSFIVKETPVFHPDLAKKYPNIKSFTGRSEDGKLRIRFSHSQKGLQAMIVNLDKKATCFLEKEKGLGDKYSAFESRVEVGQREFECSTPKNFTSKPIAAARSLVDEQILRKYRIAVSATGEYTDYHGGTVVDALAAINATLTRVNEVFETDLGVTLELIAENDQIIFTDATTDPYTGSFNAQVQNTLTTVIGEENYDVGHLFHQDNDNGNAGFIGSVCVDNQKGSAFASALIPEGDLYDLDYVAHELGHQFGANHTWSFESEGTGVQAEPASGTTIMGYAGIVEGNDVAPNGDDYFHHLSIVQIQNYLRTTGCGMNTALTNNVPVVDAQPDYVIPKGTAFVLSGSASDLDGDVLTYTWEQIDDGVVVTSTFGPDNTAGANFRSLPPTTKPERYFPRLSRGLSGDLEQVNPAENDAWETVSNVRRELNFALTVRDNNTEGGQVASDSVTVEVINTAGPFTLTSQAAGETYAGGSVQSVIWDVANTNQSPINAETVDIFLSTDGGANFSIPLAQNVPNSGNAQVQLPGVATAAGRIMVKASNTIFYSVNSSDFTITETPALLNFEDLNYTSCQPDDIIIPFVYETYGGFSENMSLIINTSESFTANFSQATVSANGTAIDVTLGNIANIAVGTYALEVIAIGASFSTSTTLEITVFDGTFGDVILSFPQDAATGTTVNPEFSWQENNNYDSFDIEIATDAAFAAIVESASVPFTSYQSDNLLPETQYFWRVKPKNPCGEGVFGPSFSFSTSVVNCSEFDTNDLPLEISEEGTPTVTAKIFLSEDLQVSDVNVNLEISHTFLEDLTVSLISPTGTRVTLLSKNCGNLNNIIAAFDDEGVEINCSGNPAINGVVKPLGSLASFNGESTLGEWVLEVEDGAVSDGGSLDAFSLEICAEGTFRPDDDEDGVFDDGDDLCLGTPKGTLVDTSGCPLNTFPVNNFTVSIQSEACRENNDGSVSIVALDETIDYTATLVGNGVDTTNAFTDQTRFSNLSSGDYQLCVVGTDDVINFRETCFDLVIERPDELSVLANLLGDGSTVRLQMSGGALYNIELNGLVEQTLENEMSIDLRPGLNSLKVTAGLECRGVFEKQFFVADSPIIFPNPASEWVTVSTSFENQEVIVSVYSIDGRFIQQNEVLVKGYTFDLNVSELSNGVYYLALESRGVSQTSKLIKK